MKKKLPKIMRRNVCREKWSKIKYAILFVYRCDTVWNNLKYKNILQIFYRWDMHSFNGFIVNTIIVNRWNLLIIYISLEYQIKLSLETSLNNIDSFNDERKDVTDCLKGKGRCSLRIKLILNLNTDNKNKIS